MKRVLVPLAPGFEEIEAITIIDILRRAGIAVTVAGTQPGVIEASRQTKHVADCTLEEIRTEDFDMVVLPGGLPGTTNLRNDPYLKTILTKCRQVAAICAAPTVLSDYGLLAERVVTSHPSVRNNLVAGKVSDERVVVDGPVITSQSAGTAMEFAFKLVEILCGTDKAAEVNRGVLARL
ncbi:MAG: Protein/nucleic acid deglycase 3 [Verrucomicrobiae bacterium]|nr:Protein/nucleic acid deglycase 3 [Verrucomicrobiae bacterium]